MKVKDFVNVFVEQENLSLIINNHYYSIEEIPEQTMEEELVSARGVWDNYFDCVIELVIADKCDCYDIHKVTYTSTGSSVNGVK